MLDRDFTIMHRADTFDVTKARKRKSTGREAGPTRRSGQAGQSPGESSSVRGPAIKETLSRILASAGLGECHAARLTGLEGGDPEDDGAWQATPVEHPPGIGLPGPRQTPAFVEMSARMVARLRHDYGPGAVNDQGRRLGDLPAVAEWLGTLEAGRMPARH